MHRDDVELAQAKGHKFHFLKVRKLERFEFEFHSLVQFLLKSAGEGDGNSLVQFKINAGVDLVLSWRPAKFLLQFFYCLLSKRGPVLSPQLGSKQSSRDLLDFRNLGQRNSEHFVNLMLDHVRLFRHVLNFLQVLVLCALVFAGQSIVDLVNRK